LYNARMKSARLFRFLIGHRVNVLASVTALLLTALPCAVYGQQFVYVAGRSENVVAAFKLNVFTGALTPIPGSPFRSGFAPGAVAVERGGRFVYVANVSSNSVSAYSIEPFSGALTEIFGSPYFVFGAPSGIA